MRILYIVVLIAALKHADAACYNGPIAACDTCGGECATGQCFCSDPSIPCVPEKGECITGGNDCCPPNYYYNVTAPCCTDTVLCNPACAADDEVCLKGTCSCDPEHYKGKTINDLKPLVECSSDVMTVSVSRCLLTYLKYDYTTLQLADNSSSCFPFTGYDTIDNNQRIDHYQIELKTGYCGNVITNDLKKLYVTNTFHYDVLHGLITVNPLRFNVTCAYNLTMQISLDFSLKPVVGYTNLPDINGIGSFPITMAAYWDDKFTSVIQQDQQVTVGTDIFLGFFITNVDGSLFTLRVVNCDASPTNNRDDMSKVSIVTGGCASNSDVPTVLEENGVSLEARIRVGTFKFQLADTVYIFCDVRLCNKSVDCTKCDSSASSRSSPDTSQVSIQVPYESLNYDLSSSSVTHSALPWSVLCGTLLGFLSIKLF